MCVLASAAVLSDTAQSYRSIIGGNRGCQMSTNSARTPTRVLTHPHAYTPTPTHPTTHTHTFEMMNVPRVKTQSTTYMSTVGLSGGYLFSSCLLDAVDHPVGVLFTASVPSSARYAEEVAERGRCYVGGVV